MSVAPAGVQRELECVSQSLIRHNHKVAKGFCTLLPKAADKVETLTARLGEHLKKMRVIWK